MSKSKRSLFEEVAGDGGGTRTKPTDMRLSEIKLKKRITLAAKNFKKIADQLEKLENSCEHRVQYDVRGTPYDQRFCAICDRCIGLV